MVLVKYPLGDLYVYSVLGLRGPRHLKAGVEVGTSTSRDTFFQFRQGKSVLRGPAFFPILPAEKVDGRIIQKDRYHIPYEGYTIELDVFGGELAPLVIAEVEFPSVEAANVFVPPAWFGEDVTENPAYSNSNLSKK